MLKLFVSATVIATMQLGLVSSADAQYMSMFNASNMAAVNIAGTISVNSAIGRSAKLSKSSRTRARSKPASAQVAVPPKRNVPYSAIRYSLDPTIRENVIASYADRARKINRAEGEEFARLFRDRDLFGETTQNFKAYGLDLNDLGDVITGYWAVSWGAVHQSGRPSVRQVQGLRRQFRSILANNQFAKDLSLADRQKVANDMTVRLILIDGGIEQGLRDGNLKQLQTISRYVQQSSLESMGIDLAALNLTSQGFVLR